MSWEGKRTHSYSVIIDYAIAQNARYAELAPVIQEAQQTLATRQNYMTTEYFNASMGRLQSLITSFPAYIVGVNSYRYFSWTWRRGPRIDSGWTYSANNSFYQEMDSLTNEIKAVTADIKSITENNCDNPYTLIGVDVNACDMNATRVTFQNRALGNKEISNSIIGKLTENDPRYPQYPTAKTVDNQINTFYNFDWANDRFPSDPAYSEYSNYTINQIYGDMGTWVAGAYDQCENKDTLMSTDDEGKPKCLLDEYGLASTTCKKALSQSIKFKYPAGTDVLTDVWKTVTDSSLGNTLSANQTTYANATTTCDKWVQMFNKWEQLEEQAATEPCVDERPVQPAYNPVIINMAEDWNRSATLYIDSLMKRLAIIQKYIETYPNILQLNEQDVTFAPSSLGSSMQLKYKVNTITPGVAPVQYLEMLVPNGAPGKQGRKGITGISGSRGRPGSTGRTGQTGDPTLPSAYT